MTTIRPRSLALCLAVGLFVAGCSKKADDGTGAASVNEVLPGSISDAMIDIDTSTASPPMAAIKEAPQKAASPSSGNAPQAAAPAVEATAQPAPESADPE